MEKNNVLEGCKILIAEDDENSFFLLQYIMDMYGAQVFHAEDGDGAIQSLQANPDLKLILMDLRMPGISGLETTQKIREFNSDIPIIAQTAVMLKEEDKSKILEAGCNDFILKPINQESLLEKIKQLLLCF